VTAEVLSSCGRDRKIEKEEEWGRCRTIGHHWTDDAVFRKDCSPGRGREAVIRNSARGIPSETEMLPSGEQREGGTNGLHNRGDRGFFRQEGSGVF